MDATAVRVGRGEWSVVSGKWSGSGKSSVEAVAWRVGRTVAGWVVSVGGCGATGKIQGSFPFTSFRVRMTALEDRAGAGVGLREALRETETFSGPPCLRQR